MITKEKKTAVISGSGRHKTDTGSTEVQVSILSARIKELTEHSKLHKKDHASRRGLLQMVGRRKRLLSDLATNEPTTYTGLVKKLGLRK